MSGRVVHGGVTEAELAAAAAAGIELVDLSASLNPYGPHPAVTAAAANATIGRYPEPDAAKLRRAWADRFGLEPGQVLAGNGTSELIYLLCRAFAGDGGCLVFGPTFGEYAAAARAAGMSSVEVPYPARGSDAGRLFAELRPSLAFLCNPNNPTGELCSREQVEQLRRAALAVCGRLVVDEAYMPFAWPEDESVEPAPGMLVLRSLTKVHAVPGLRLGFLLGTPDDIERVSAQQPPWSVSAPATAAGMAALKLEAFCRESAGKVAATRARLLDALERAGFAVRPSLANFLLVRVGDGAAFRARLLGRGFVVRDCASFGLPEWVRVAVPHERYVERLFEAMSEVRRCLAGES